MANEVKAENFYVQDYDIDASTLECPVCIWSGYINPVIEERTLGYLLEMANEHIEEKHK